MSRMMLLFGCIALVTSCCIAKGTEDSSSHATDSGVRAWYYHDGTKSAVPQADSLSVLLQGLLVSSSEQLLLIVDQEFVTSLQAEGSALEIVLPEPIKVRLFSGVQHKLDRILVPLAGENGPSPDDSSVMILHGYKGYGTGPVVNTDASVNMLKIRQILEQ